MPDQSLPEALTVDLHILTRSRTCALMELAGLTVKNIWELVNVYDRRLVDSPWWLVETQHGLIQIGWRHHIIHIDWEAIGTHVPVITPGDQVTAGPTFVHAGSLAKAVEYLTTLRRHLDERASKLVARVLGPGPGMEE